MCAASHSRTSGTRTTRRDPLRCSPPARGYRSPADGSSRPRTGGRRVVSATPTGRVGRAPRGIRRFQWPTYSHMRTFTASIGTNFFPSPTTPWLSTANDVVAARSGRNSARRPRSRREPRLSVPARPQARVGAPHRSTRARRVRSRLHPERPNGCVHKTPTVGSLSLVPREPDRRGESHTRRGASQTAGPRRGRRPARRGLLQRKAVGDADHRATSDDRDFDHDGPRTGRPARQARSVPRGVPGRRTRVPFNEGVRRARERMVPVAATAVRVCSYQPLGNGSDALTSGVPALPVAQLEAETNRLARYPVGSDIGGGCVLLPQGLFVTFANATERSSVATQAGCAVPP